MGVGRGDGEGVFKRFQSEKLDILDKHKGALQCGKPLRPQEDGARLCLD